MKIKAVQWLLVAVLFASGGMAAGGDELEPGVRLKAAGKLIDTEVGHAAPFLYDLDSDGDRDLLVGQFGEGKLRVYRNVGTLGEPRFTEHKLFQAEGADGKVPTG